MGSDFGGGMLGLNRKRRENRCQKEKRERERRRD